MITFESFTEDKKGIFFKNSGDETLIVNAKIVDGYTNFVVWTTKIIILPNVSIWYNHYILTSKYRSFEIWDEKSENILLKVNLVVDDSVDIKEFDTFKKLKNFKYLLRNIDAPGFPLFEIFIRKDYEFEKCKIEDGDIVVDIGGNIGLFSYYSLCNGASKIYCFEPGKETCAAIKENFGDFENLVIENVAVTSLDGIVDFIYNPESTIGSSAIEKEKDWKFSTNNNKIKVKSINFYNYSKEKSINKIDFLKIDCEGAEYEILDSIPDDFFINSINKLTVEYHENTGQLKRHIDRLINLGFEIKFKSADDIKNKFGIFYGWNNNYEK